MQSYLMKNLQEHSMKIEFTNIEGWKDACARLANTTIDYPTGTTENPFLIIHNPDQPWKLCGGLSGV